MIAFGPVPSRRLGRSLGIDAIAPKACTYSCTYCQVGPTARTEIEPRAFLPPEQVAAAVGARLSALARRGERADVLTFVPAGEPTLDVDLGRAIDALRTFGLPIAVITNGSLLWREDVCARVGRADVVSVKVDAASEVAWRRVNRPHPALRLGTVLEGIRRFAATFRGRLLTETMLLDGVNDGADEVARTADVVAGLAPRVAYVAVPIRPVAVPGLRPAGEEAVLRAWAALEGRVERVEFLVGGEGVDVGATGDVEEDLLATAAVHTLREEQARALCAAAPGGQAVLARLLAQGRLRRVAHGGKGFYVRPLPGTTPERAPDGGR